MTHPRTTTELADPLADLDEEEDLACAGLYRVRPLEEVIARLRERKLVRRRDGPKPPKPSKPRKPSIRTLIERGKAAGVTAVTLPDGTRFELGTPEATTDSNPWLIHLNKVAKR